MLLQLCEHRAGIISQLNIYLFILIRIFSNFPIIITHRLSQEHGDALNEDICYTEALNDFGNQYPLSSGIFSKSKTIIKPFELFGLLFSFADYKAIHAALLNQAKIIYADNKMPDSIQKFEKSLNKMYDLSACLNPDNMFERDIDLRDIEREMAMPGAKPREIQKKMMKKLIEQNMRKTVDSRPKRDIEKLYLNQQLEIDLNAKEEQGVKEVDWSSIYTRENGRIIVDEVRESMKVCVDALIDERNKNICDTLMNCDGTNIVAFVNFANIDGIEDRWLTLA